MVLECDILPYVRPVLGIFNQLEFFGSRIVCDVLGLNISMGQLSPLQIYVGIDLLIENGGELEGVEALPVFLSVHELPLQVTPRVLKKLFYDVERGTELGLEFDGVVFEREDVGVLVQHSLLAAHDDLSGGLFIIDLPFHHSEDLFGVGVLQDGNVAESGVLDLVSKLEGLLKGAGFVIVFVSQCHLQVSRLHVWIHLFFIQSILYN